MKFDHFRQIIAKIQRDIPCPRCDEALTEELIDVYAASDREIEFFALCPHCGAEASICAHIQPILSVITNPLYMHNQARSRFVLSPESVQRITQALQTYEGRDIRELF